MKRKKRIAKRMLCWMLIVAMLAGWLPENTAKVKAASGNDVVSVALGELRAGYAAGAGKNNKYGASFGANGQDWCAYFVAWCMKTAGVPQRVYNYSSYQLGRATPNDNITSGVWHSRGTYTPKPGDTIYIDWGANSIYPDHVELVSSISNGTIYTISGNSGGGNGKVVAHSWSPSDTQIKGYCEIDYTGRTGAARVVWGSGNGGNSSVVSNVADMNNPDIHPVPTRTLRKGHNGNDVRWVQAILNRLGYASISVDGAFGNATYSAVRTFQQRNGLGVDGIVGYYTRTKMQELWNATKVVYPSSISISAGSAEVTVGYTSQLAANVQPGNASNRSVAWSSSNNGIVTVSNGTIRGISAGTATITASTHNGKTARCNVTVRNACKVTFQDEDGTVLSEQKLPYGGSAKAPQPPEKTGYNFSGWEGTYQGVKSDSIVQAKYTKKKYKVTFKETNGEKIEDTQTVLYEEAAKAPEQEQLKIPDGYQFHGWSEPFDHVSSDMTIYPVYQWADDELPMVVSADQDACKADYDEGVYSVSFTVKNHSDKTRNVKIMTYMSTKEGKLVAQGETRTVRVPAAKDGTDGSKLVEDMIITCKDAADKAKVVVLDDYESAVPLAEIKEIDVEAAGYGKWTDKKPEAGNQDYLEREVYRSKKVNYTTSTNTAIAGWTQYGSGIDHYNYGGWVYAGNGGNVRSNDTTRSDAINYNPNPYSYPYPDNIIVRQGQQGAQGCYIQACLIHLGYGVAFDGIYGANTAAAIRSFQASNGLSVDGLVGPTTKAKLTERFNALPKYHYYTRSKTPVYKYQFYKIDDNWSDWSAEKISGDTAVQAGKTKVLVETAKQYRYKEFETDNSGTEITRTYELPEEAKGLSGKNAVAIVFKNKVSQISEDNVEYMGDTKIGNDGKVSLSFVPREEQTYAGTGDYTVALGVKGTTNYIYLGTIAAPKPKYQLNFVDDDGNKISEQEVEEGGSAELPDIPEKEGYIFTGWDNGVTNIHSDLTIMATYKKQDCTVTYVDWENHTIAQQKYQYGDEIKLPDAPKAPEKLEFAGWSIKEGTVVEQDMVCEAIFQKEEFTVTFVDWEGKEIQKQSIPYGETATEPEVKTDSTESVVASDAEKKEASVPEKVDGMTFVSWGEDIDLSNVTANLTVGAIYRFDETVAAPTASVRTGEYAQEQTVTLTTETEGADIYYTLDGSDPMDAENVSVKRYTAPIRISAQTKLKFYALKMGMNDSSVEEEWYAINKAGNVPVHIINICSENIYDTTDVVGYKGFVKDGDKLNIAKLLTEEYMSVEVSGIYYDKELTDKWQDAAETITESLTLYAVYDAKQYTVTYQNEEGEELTKKKVSYGQSAQNKDIAPAKTGYRFAEWVNEQEDVSFVTKDMTVQARYVRAEEYVTIKFGRKSYSVMEGSTYNLIPKVRYEASGKAAEQERIVWSSSDEAVATVDANGVIQALTKGSVTITAKVLSSAETAVCTIHVTGNPDTSVCLYSNSSYHLDSDILRNISPEQNTVKELEAQINAERLKFISRDGVELTDTDRVGTGTKVQLLDEEFSVVDEVYVVITGDYNGDGKINGMDVSGLSRCLLEKETADNIQMLGIDVNGDGYVNNRDAAMLGRYLVGKEKLS